MAAIDEISVKLGLKTADFKAALKSAGVDVKAFKAAGAGDKGGFADSLKGLTQRVGQFRSLVLGGGIITGISAIFSSAITYAENYTGALTENIGALLRLKDSQNFLQGFAANVVGGIAGFMEKVGFTIGAVVYGINSAQDAVQKMRAETEKAFSAELVKKTDEAVANLTKTRLDAALQAATAEEKILILQAEGIRLAAEQAKVRGNIVEFLKQQATIEKNDADLAKARAEAAVEQEKSVAQIVKLQGELRDAQFALLDDAQQVNALKKEEADLQNLLYLGESNSVDTLEAQIRLAEVRLSIAQKTKAIDDEALRTEKERTDAIKASAAGWDTLFKAFADASKAAKAFKDAEADRSKRSLGEIAAGGKGTTGTSQAAANKILRLEAEAARARASGFGSTADARMKAADALRGKLAPVLKSGEVDPLAREREAAIKESRDYLKEIKKFLEPTEV